MDTNTGYLLSIVKIKRETEKERERERGRERERATINIKYYKKGGQKSVT